MTWIDYKKAYGMVLHSWISDECSEMFGITMYKHEAMEVIV